MMNAKVTSERRGVTRPQDYDVSKQYMMCLVDISVFQDDYMDARSVRGANIRGGRGVMRQRVYDENI